MKSILYQAPFAITEIDFVPGPFRCWIELGHIDFAAVLVVFLSPSVCVAPEVTVTSLRPPRLCRLAVFSTKPTLLSFLPFGTLESEIRSAISGQRPQRYPGAETRRQKKMGERHA